MNPDTYRHTQIYITDCQHIFVLRINLVANIGLVYLWVWMIIDMNLLLPVCLFDCLPTWIPFCLPLFLVTFLPIYMSIYPYVPLSICISFHLIICPYILPCAYRSCTMVYYSSKPGEGRNKADIEDGTSHNCNYNHIFQYLLLWRGQNSITIDVSNIAKTFNRNNPWIGEIFFSKT